MFALCKVIAKLILKIPPSLFELRQRAELSTPLLKFIAEVLQRLKEPTVRFLEYLADLRQMKAAMDKKHTRDCI